MLGDNIRGGDHSSFVTPKHLYDAAQRVVAPKSLVLYTPKK
jgi:hypothetical protein